MPTLEEKKARYQKLLVDAEKTKEELSKKIGNQEYLNSSHPDSWMGGGQVPLEEPKELWREIDGKITEWEKQVKEIDERLTLKTIQAPAEDFLERCRQEEEALGELTESDEDE